MATIKTYGALVDYIKLLCKNNKSLNPDNEAQGRFYPYRDSFAGLSIKFPALVFVPPVNRLIDGLSDNIHISRQSELWIVKDVRPEDYDAQTAAITECEAIGLELMAQVYADFKAYVPDRKIKYFDPNNVEWEELGPVADNAYGVALKFGFSNPRPIVKDNTKWW